MYELFLKIHLLLAVLLVSLLWFHIPIKETRAIAYLVSVSGLWILQQTAWLGYFAYWNTGSRRSLVKRSICSRGGTKSHVMTLIVLTEMSHRIRPGHYVYLTFPGLNGHPLSLLQSHPYVVAWKEGSECSFLIQQGSGLSNDIFKVSQPGPRVFIDGPYGQAQSFEGYEKVLFLANGIGVAAHFLSIRALIEAEITKSTCVRRISLAWLVETSGKCR